MLENYSILGPFFKVSYLPCNLGFETDYRGNVTYEKLNNEMKAN